jgi:geranylgeranylglycerol-phosphate geranylgeranyltransferase
MFLSIIRPINCAMVFAAVLILCFLAVGSVSYVDLVAAMSAALVCAGGNTVNDYFDVASDRKNKPHRPIPSGEISRENALILAIALFTGGLIAAAFVGTSTFAFVLLIEAVLLTYSWIKKRVLVGNVLVSLLLALVVIFPTTFHQVSTTLVLLAVPLFLLNFSREIVKDIGDVAGDRKSGRRTFPIVEGVREASILSSALFALACLSVLVFVMRWWDLGLFVSLIVVVVVSSPVLARFIKAPDREHLIMERFEKVAMLIFLVGLVI